MTAFQTALARNPAATPELLAHLLRHARIVRATPGTFGATGPRTRPGIDLLAALAANPALPDSLLRELEQDRSATVRQAILTRPGYPTERALTLLRTERRALVLSAALVAVDDPDGTVAHLALDRSDTESIRTAVLLSPRTTEPARARAALLLAADPATTAASAALVVTFARRATADVLIRLRVEAGTSDLRAALYTVAERRLTRGPWPTPGRASKARLSAWLDRPETLLDDVLAYVRAETRPALLNTAIVDFPDSTGQVAAAALRACDHPSVASSILRVPTIPGSVQKEAARRVIGTCLDQRRAAMAARFVGEDLDLAVTAAREARAWRVIRACQDRPDLPAEAVTALVDRAFDTADTKVPQHPAFMAWAATHPNATVTDRERCRREIEQQHEQHARFAGVPHPHPYLLAWATAGGQAGTDGPVPAVRDLPCAAVQAVRKWSDHPGLAALITGALPAILGDRATDEAVTSVLSALAGDFVGTVGELVDTVAAITAGSR